MARRVFHAAFGAYLATLRKDARIAGQRQAARIALNRGIEGLPASKILELERGQREHVAPDTLRALATLYRADYADLVRAHAQMVYGIDIDHRPQLTPDEREALELWRGASDDGRYHAAAVLRRFRPEEPDRK